MIDVKSTPIGDSGWEEKSIYLRKSGEEGFVGLHSTGMTAEGDIWCNMEAYANSYGEDKKFQASIFRIFGPIEDTAEDMIKEGWEIVENFL